MHIKYALLTICITICIINYMRIKYAINLNSYNTKA